MLLWRDSLTLTVGISHYKLYGILTLKKKKNANETATTESGYFSFLGKVKRSWKTWHRSHGCVPEWAFMPTVQSAGLYKAQEVLFFWRFCFIRSGTRSVWTFWIIKIDEKICKITCACCFGRNRVVSEKTPRLRFFSGASEVTRRGLNSCYYFIG